MAVKKAKPGEKVPKPGEKIPQPKSAAVKRELSETRQTERKAKIRAQAPPIHRGR